MKRSVLVFIILLYLPTESLSCTCAQFHNLTPKEASRKFKDISIIFLGEVAVVRDTSRSNDNSLLDKSTQDVTFRVVKAWKGVESPEITVPFTLHCGPSPWPGEAVIVFAGKNVDGAMSYVSYCSLNLFTEEQVVREFGAGHEFPSPSPSPMPQPTPAEEKGFFVSLWEAIASIFS